MVGIRSVALVEAMINFAVKGISVTKVTSAEKMEFVIPVVPICLVKETSATRGFIMMTTTESVIFTVIWATDAAKGTCAMGGMSA